VKRAVSVLGKGLLTIWTHHGDHAGTAATTHPKEKARFQAFGRADDGTRTHDLLHGKYMRNVPVRSEVAWLNASAS
jgi:hypothetical protein